MSRVRSTMLLIGTILLCLISIVTTYFGLLSFGVIEGGEQEITVKLQSSSKVYDGTPLNSTEFTYDEENLDPEHTIEVEYLNSQTEVGTIAIKAKVLICDKNGKDVTNKYLVTIDSEGAVFEVAKRPITITYESNTKDYDGTALEEANFSITSGSLVRNHVIQNLFDNSVVTPGDVEAVKATPVIYDETGIDVTSNYKIDIINNAQLSINPKELLIQFEDYYKIYDGKTIKSSDLEYECIGLINNHKFVFTEEFERMLTECVSAKTKPYEINFVYDEYAPLYKIIDKDGYDVTNYYTKLNATFSITVDKKDLYVYGYNGSLILNDSKSIDNEYEKAEGLVKDHIINIKYDFKSEDNTVFESFSDIKKLGTYKTVAKTNNGFKVITIYDESRNVVTDNYNINYVDGKINVINKIIHIDLGNLNKIYDGQAFKLKISDYVSQDSSLEELVNSHYIEFEEEYINVCKVSENKGKELLLRYNNVPGDENSGKIDVRYSIIATYQLEITPLDIYVNSSVEKYYDGKLAVPTNVNITVADDATDAYKAFANNYSLKCREFTCEYLNVCNDENASLNVDLIEIYKNNKLITDKDILNNFNFIDDGSKVKINKVKIEISADNNSIYNGEVVTPENVVILDVANKVNNQVDGYTKEYYEAYKCFMNLYNIKGSSYVIDSAVGYLKNAGVYTNVMLDSSKVNVYDSNGIIVSNTVLDNYEFIDKGSKVVINKAKYNMEGITFDSNEIDYDAKDHSLEIKGDLPQGVIVKYYYNNKEINSTNPIYLAGKYNIVAKFEGDSLNYELIPSLEAQLVINKIDLDLKFEDLIDVVYGDEEFIPSLDKTLFENVAGELKIKDTGDKIKTQIFSFVDEYKYVNDSTNNAMIKIENLFIESASHPSVNVLDCYNIPTELSCKIKINKKPITVTGEYSEMYTGEYVEITTNNLFPCYDLQFEDAITEINLLSKYMYVSESTENANVSVKIYDSEGSMDVTDNYLITYNFEISINKLDPIIDDIRLSNMVYNGNAYQINLSELNANLTLGEERYISSAVLVSNCYDVNQYDNIGVMVRICDKYGVDITSCYESIELSVSFEIIKKELSFSKSVTLCYTTDEVLLDISELRGIVEDTSNPTSYYYSINCPDANTPEVYDITNQSLEDAGFLVDSNYEINGKIEVNVTPIILTLSYQAPSQVYDEYGNDVLVYADEVLNSYGYYGLNEYAGIQLEMYPTSAGDKEQEFELKNFTSEVNYEVTIIVNVHISKVVDKLTHVIVEEYDPNKTSIEFNLTEIEGLDKYTNISDQKSIDYNGGYPSPIIITTSELGLEEENYDVTVEVTPKITKVAKTYNYTYTEEYDPTITSIDVSPYDFDDMYVYYSNNISIDLTKNYTEERKLVDNDLCYITLSIVVNMPKIYKTYNYAYTEEYDPTITSISVSSNDIDDMYNYVDKTFDINVSRNTEYQIQVLNNDFYEINLNVVVNMPKIYRTYNYTYTEEYDPTVTSISVSSNDIEDMYNYVDKTFDINVSRNTEYQIQVLNNDFYEINLNVVVNMPKVLKTYTFTYTEEYDPTITSISVSSNDIEDMYNYVDKSFDINVSMNYESQIQVLNNDFYEINLKIIVAMKKITRIYNYTYTEEYDPNVYSISISSYDIEDMSNYVDKSFSINVQSNHEYEELVLNNDYYDIKLNIVVNMKKLVINDVIEQTAYVGEYITVDLSSYGVNDTIYIDPYGTTGVYYKTYNNVSNLYDIKLVIIITVI